MATTMTARGFSIYAQFHDTYGADVRVQESSKANAPCVWVFVTGGAARRADGGPNDGHLHLSREQARQLIAALQAFVDEYPDTSAQT